MKRLLLAFLACLTFTGAINCKNVKGVKEDAFEIIKPSPAVQEMLKRFCSIDDEESETEKKIVCCIFVYTSKKK